jgi:Mg2+ and Co2+ transporter CorA
LQENAATNTYQLENLFSLKQQASITSTIDAKAALARADESVRQGRAIMMFTVITIIFLPLSFMPSIFGMNARALLGPQGGILSLRYQFKFMCES